MRYRILTTLLLLITPLATAFAADVFYDVPIGDLKLASGSAWPDGTPPQQMIDLFTRVTMDGQAEAYPGGQPAARLAVRAPANEPLSGTIALTNVFFHEPNTLGNILHFTVTAKPSDEARTAFYQAKQEHYANLQRQRLPGAAWFRYQADSAGRELGKTAPANIPSMQRNFDRGDMYDLFSGGRAVAENLQLDRALQIRGNAKDDVKVDTLPGITIKEMDFTALLKGAQVKADPLARHIPADQYAVFFPSFPAVLDLMDRVENNSVPVMQNMMPQSADAGILKRYQTQIGLHASNIARLLGPQFVRSVAVTGSDPSFAMGTDVALLFESPNPTALQTMLLAQISQNTAGQQGIRTVTENIEGIGAVQSFRADYRTVNSYVARLDDTIIVTNSLVQVRKLADLKAGKIKPLADSPEYQFFRARYEIAKGDETAFLVISDATIRKWCSARYRIADARRIQDLAKANNDVAADADLTFAGRPGPSRSLPYVIYQPNGLLIPVAEMQFDTVTKAEADAYAQWRDGYQRNWSGVFDPIALRISLRPQQMAGDLTIMPLIATSEYRQFINFSEGASLSAADGDPHGALAHGVFAINRKSQTARSWSTMGKSMLPGVTIDPLGWLGNSVALYADDDPYWKELAAANDTDQFMQHNIGRLPVALRAEANSPLKLALFISAARALIEQSAPGLTTWEPQEYNGKAYVRISSKGNNADVNYTIYYAALPDSLTVTLNESVIKHALDRAIAATQPAAAQTAGAQPAFAIAKPQPATRPWLGKNLAVQVRGDSMNLFSRLARDSFGRKLQRSSWNNLPILNEWKRLAPAKDPVAVHEQLWGVKLLCPAGGQYVWNKDRQTMESTVVGCPEFPKSAPENLLQFRGINFANFGLTFENQGLRAQVELDTAPTK